MIKTIEQLKEIRDSKIQDINIRFLAHDMVRMPEKKAEIEAEIAKHPHEHHIVVCASTGCLAGKAGELIDLFERKIKEAGKEDTVKVVKTGCFGLCAVGPVVILYPDSIFYEYVDIEKAERIFNEHIMNGQIVRDVVYSEAFEGDEIVPFENTHFFKKQLRVALRNCGLLDPEIIEEYIAHDGYFALAKVLTEMQPNEVIDLIKASGLRGRGGAGFSTGMKWSFAAAQPPGQKYIVCNGDEGDPGAFMDRSILEGDPHAVLEAMAIAGYAVGADFGYLYVRAEYPIAIKRLEIAMQQARELGLLGKNIFGTDFSFDVKVKPGAGAFVCGEETALLMSIEGGRGEPVPRPPFPAVKGLFGKPTIINNVETLSNVAQIVLRGAEWFAGMGTEKSKGSKVFALGGKVENVGLIEVPMGITLREVIEEIGGGIPGGKKFKAAQTGGPSGGCIPESLYDAKIDFDHLIELGSMMGSGGLIVMDEDNCMVDIAKFFLEFTVDESCGKCTPCRVGTKRLHEILDKITKGLGTMADLDDLETLSHFIKENSLCGLGQTAPNPVLSTLKYFKHEYLEHINNKKCPSKVCQDLVQYIITDKCIGCGMCVRVCPTNCISGEKKEKHIINQADCIKCGLCMSKCPPKIGAIVLE